jgi:hypothetical protein
VSVSTTQDRAQHGLLAKDRAFTPTPNPFGIGGPIQQALSGLAPRPYPLGTPEPPPPGPDPETGPITSIINYLIQATVYFPAKTFQRAVEKAARAIFTGQLEELGQPFRVLIGMFVRPDTPIFGGESLSSGLSGIGTVMTQAAVPLWALSLALLGLAVVTRSAAALGYGLGETASELIRWFFVCLLSGNAVVIVNMTHGAINLLAGGIAGVGLGDVAESLWLGLFPNAMLDPEFPLLLLMIGLVLAMILVAVMVISYVARFVLLLILGALAPLAIATEGIPFTRFVCREWLGAFLKVELLQVMNATVLVVFGKVLTLLTGASGTIGVITSFVVMVGIVSVIATLNFKVFQYVFGAAIGVVEQSIRLAAGLIAFAATGGLSGGFTLASAAGLAGLVGNATGDPLSRGLSDGLRSGSQAAQQNEMSDYAKRLRAGSPATNGNGNRSGSDVSAAPNPYRTPQMLLMSARDAQRTAEAHRREADLQAASTGAATSDEKASVKSAFGSLSAAYGKDQTDRAAQAVAPTLRAMARQNREGLSGVAAALGYTSAGELVGAFAEENVVGQKDGTVATMGRLFGAPPAQTMLQNSLGYAPTPISAPANATEANTLQARAAQAMGARTPEEVQRVSDVLGQLNTVQGESATAQAAQSISPAMSALAARAGGLSALASQAGFADVGQLTGAVLGSALSPIAESASIASRLGATTPDEALSISAATAALAQSYGDNRAGQAINAVAPTMRALAPAFATNDSTGLSGLAQTLGYSDAGALTRDLAEAHLAPHNMAQPSPAIEPSAPFFNRWAQISNDQPLATLANRLGFTQPETLMGSLGEAHAFTQPNTTPPQFLPPAVAAGLPLASRVLRSPEADASQQALALGAATPDETMAVAGAIGAMNNAYGPDATRQALTHIAPSLHAASAHVGLGQTAQALGYSDAGTFVGAWTESAAISQSPNAIPASAPLFSPTMPLATNSSSSVSSSPFNLASPAFQGLISQHGEAAVNASIASSRPSLDALAARYNDGQDNIGYPGLATRAGFADPPSMAAAVVGQHLSPPAMPAQETAPFGSQTPDEARSIAGALHTARAAYGDPAVNTALRAVAPTLRGMCEALSASESGSPLASLAQSLGFADVGRMTGALVEDHALQQQGVSAPEHGPLFGGPMPRLPAPTTSPTNPLPLPVPSTQPELTAQALSINTPPDRPVPFDQVAGMALAQRMNLSPNFGPVLSNLTWSLRAESTDPGLFWQTYRAADEIGAAHPDPKQAYDAFRQFVDGLYDQHANDAPFHRPWRPEAHPLPGRRAA